MKPRTNGLVELVDDKSSSDGFFCMKLVEFLTIEGVKDWDTWHKRHLLAENGNCTYTSKCPIYARTVKKHPHQLSLFNE